MSSTGSRASAQGYSVTLVVDAVAVRGGAAERLEVDLELFDETTAGAVMRDLSDSLADMDMRLLGPPRAYALVFRDAGKRLALPALHDGDSSAALAAAYERLYKETMEDMRTVMISGSDDDTVLLRVPRIERALISAQAAPKAYLTALWSPSSPDGDGADGEAAESGGDVQQRAPSSPAHSSPAPAPASFDLDEWAASQLLQRPASAFDEWLQNDKFSPKPYGAADEELNSVQSEARRRAAVLVEKAIQAELAGPLATIEGENMDQQRARIVSRTEWLSRCAREAELYEEETRRLELLIARKVAWREATLRKLQQEVSQLSERAKESAQFARDQAVLKTRLAELRTDADDVKKVETALLVQLKEQRASPTPRHTEASSIGLDPISPSPRPPLSPHVGAAALAVNRTAVPSAYDAADHPVPRPLVPVEPALDGDGSAQAVPSAARAPGAPPLLGEPVSSPSAAAGGTLSQETSDIHELRATQLSYSGATPTAGAEHSAVATDESFFFSPSIRRGVEEALASDRGSSQPESKVASPLTPASWQRGVGSNSEQAFTSRWSAHERQRAGAAVPSSSAGGEAEGGSAVSLSERLRMVTADVSRHIRSPDRGREDPQERDRLLQTIRTLRGKIEAERRTAQSGSASVASGRK